MRLLFVMSTGDNWEAPMFMMMAATEPGHAPVRNDYSPAAFFSIVWMFVGSFFALNLFVGVICDSFNKIKRETNQSATMTQEQQQWVDTMRALGAMAVGHCTRALEITLDYVKQRQAFGGTLWDQQTIRQRLSMLDAKTRAARQFMYHCAWSVTQGHDIVQEVSMLKALTGELVNEVVQTCQQFHGGMGFIRETAIERLWRDARVLAIGGGATEVMLEEVAKRY